MGGLRVEVTNVSNESTYTPPEILEDWYKVIHRDR